MTVYANDTVGRKGNSETVYFNITQETEQEFTAQPETFPITPVAVVSGVSVAVVAAGLLVYFRKRRRGQPT